MNRHNPIIGVMLALFLTACAPFIVVETIAVEVPVEALALMAP